MNYLNITTDHEFHHILCGRLIADSFVHMERNMDIHVLIVIEKGILNIEIGGCQFKAHSGDVIILPANVTHRGFRDEDTDGHIEYFWTHFYLDDKFLLDSAREGDFSLPLHFTLTDYARVRILYNQLLDVYMLTGARKKYCDFLFTALCCEIAAQAEYESVSGNNTVNRAVAWIELNIRMPISLDETAAALGYNKRYLARIFREHTGMTVNEFIMEKKLILAKQLLTGSDETVTSIAATIGFADAGYFMRTFKKHEGVTCLEYRNAYSKMYVNEK